MKTVLVVIFLFLTLSSVGQRRYRCIYTDTTEFSFPDTVLKLINANLEEKDFPGQAFNQMRTQLSIQTFYKIQEREIVATQDSTIIRFRRETLEGNLNVNSLDSLLMKQGELYLQAATESGFSDLPESMPKKTFRHTGETVNILNYKCAGYISTDSLCRIWVASILPSYINPGIRTGALHGAVLAFELQTGRYLIKSKLKRIE